uniref:PDZ domain containing 4 n=1 Tax=Paramormyrops kingsleyae TaxID=1676925 RepID=A0A3B3SG63_9TELE
MGCNMCVMQKPEEQYRVMFQVNGKELSRLSQERPAGSLRAMRDPLLIQVVRRGPRRKGSSGGPMVTTGAAMVSDCTDSSTQTDISFQHMQSVGRAGHSRAGPPLPPPSPPLHPVLEPYLLNDLPHLQQDYYDPNDYFDSSHHEVDRQDEFEYEVSSVLSFVFTLRSGHICWRGESPEELFQVNPNSIAAKDGRIREGDRILQINGVDIQNREEAVAILTREDSTNISLLLARPDMEVTSKQSLIKPRKAGIHRAGGQLSRCGEAVGCSRSPYRETPALSPNPLSNSQELDSGVGRTDESTRNEESSEHDLLGDDHTSASNTNATNTPGSMRKFIGSRGDTPPLLHSRELHFSTDSLLGLEGGSGGGYSHDPALMMPGLTEEECERYRELLEIKCHYEKNGNALLMLGRGVGGGGAGVAGRLDVNRNESLVQHEMALLEEELRHLEFKCRNILRAQKMQQLRERCMKAWLLEAAVAGRAHGATEPGVAEDPSHHELSDITEVPERERSDKDSSSAYNTGGESCRSTPLASELLTPHCTHEDEPRDLSASARHTERAGQASNLNHSYFLSMNSKRAVQEGDEDMAKFRSLSQDDSARRGSEVGLRRSPKGSGTMDRRGGRSADNSPYFSRRQHVAKPPARYQSCVQRAPLPLALPPVSPRMEWKVKVRSDGSRYVAKRPVRDRLLKARAMKIREERSGTTTDDDAISEMKMGRYWSKEERKQQLMRAREYRRRREFMMQSRLECLREQQGATGADRAGQQGAPQEASILELSQRKSMKKRSRRILDNWITIQELLAHGSRSADGKKVYNPLLSVTTV